jgi:hypothetical protein
VHVGHVAARRLDGIEGFIGQGRFVDALDHTQEFIQLTLEGLRYLQTYVHLPSPFLKRWFADISLRYDRFLIQTIVVAAYTGWIAHGASIVLLDKTPGTFPRFSWSLLVPISILATCWASFALQHSPWSFYVYVVFPVYFWNSAISRTWSPVRLIISSNRLTLKAVLRWMVRGIVVVTTLICMVVCLLFGAFSYISLTTSIASVHTQISLERWICDYWHCLATSLLATGNTQTARVIGVYLVGFMHSCSDFSTFER